MHSIIIIIQSDCYNLLHLFVIKTSFLPLWRLLLTQFHASVIIKIRRRTSYIIIYNFEFRFHIECASPRMISRLSLVHWNTVISKELLLKVQLKDKHLYAQNFSYQNCIELRELPSMLYDHISIRNIWRSQEHHNIQGMHYCCWMLCSDLTWDY